MANSLIPPPEFDPSRDVPLRPVEDAKLDEMVIEEQGVFSSLWANLKDVFFPQKLPELVLESKPVPVKDLMATRQDPRATGAAFVIYAVLILLLVWILKQKVLTPPKQVPVQVVDLTAPPPITPPKAVSMGGGGGQHGPTPVTKGTPPKAAENQIVPPKPPPLQQPKIAIEPTIDVQKDLKMQSSIPQLGVANSPLVGMSMGNGHGTGLGSGNGAGIGPGSGGNTGGGPRRIGGGVSAPQLIYQVEPEFSEEARKAKVQGNVLVNLWVDTNGMPKNVHVLRGVGMGLDEKAVEAVKQYRFKPAMENGKPVLVELNVEVNFQIF